MITFKIQDKKHVFPTRWEDVTFSQYLTLLTLPNSIIDYISLFTAIPRETLAKAELKNLESIVTALAFLSVPFKAEEGPSKMVGPWVLPKDVTLQSLGQFEDLRELLKQLPKEETIEDMAKLSHLYLEACAIYVQKVRDGEYDPQKVPQVKEELMNAPCTEVIRTGSFFLFKPLNTLTNTTSRYQRASRLLKKMLQDFPGYRKSLDSLQRSLKLPSK